ncbi:F-box family protein [Quillaja saponaria]|uniref:F-box family protein n=1 Tax=Quillaja saponaria TaxID=32244 RepID=A0AAD7KK12_QUISA|nr:F-box family protein [Quillaja saponaria]
MEKGKQKMVEDRLSNLPDGILQHILSLFGTRITVQTSVLGKRWRSCLNLKSLLLDDCSLDGDVEHFRYLLLSLLTYQFNFQCSSLVEMVLSMASSILYGYSFSFYKIRNFENRNGAA